MGVLSSKLFTEGDPKTVKTLEDCATGRPSEWRSHFSKTENTRGEHVRKVKQALKNVQQLEPDLGIPAFEVNDVYDEAFARAIAVYKEKRNIRNYANKIDDIVGVKTIKSLDTDATKRSNVDPPPNPKKRNEYPRPVLNCTPDEDCPLSREFDITLLAGVSGGEIAEAAKFFFTIRDTTNGLSSLYVFRGGGAGVGLSPVTPAVAGTATHFQTAKPVRVTRFGPLALMTGGAAPIPGTPIPLSATLLSLSFRPDGARGLPQTPFFAIDTGPISIPGVSFHGAQFKILTTCKGQPGATRKVLGPMDVGPIE